MAAVFCQTAVCGALTIYCTQKYWDENHQPAEKLFYQVPDMKYPDGDEYYRTDTKNVFINTGLVSAKPSVNVFASNISGSVFEFYAAAAQVEGIYFVSVPWDGGFTATVNGQQVPVLKVNNDFVGIPMPAGDNSVQLSYRPQGLTAGAAVSAVCLTALVGYALASREKRLPAASGV